MILLDSAAENINLQKVFYPLWWLNVTGYFDNKAFTGPNVIAFEPNPIEETTSDSLSYYMALFLTAVTSCALTLGAVALVLRKRSTGSITPQTRFDYARIEL